MQLPNLSLVHTHGAAFETPAHHRLGVWHHAHCLAHPADAPSCPL